MNTDTGKERALRVLAEVLDSNGYAFFFVGAFARDLLLDHKYRTTTGIRRATDDIDLCVEVPTWQAYEAIMAQLCEVAAFSRDSKIRHRLYKGGLQVDIVPFGGLESPPELIRMDEFEMSTVGMAAVQDHLENLEVGDLRLPVCSLAGLVILKLIAWNEGRERRRKDAADIVFLLRHFYEWELEQDDSEVFGRYSEVFEADEEFTVELAGTYMLAKEAGRLLENAPETLRLLRQILRAELSDPLSSELISAAGGPDNIPILQRFLEAF